MNITLNQAEYDIIMKSLLSQRAGKVINLILSLEKQRVENNASVTEGKTVAAKAED